MSKEGRRGNQRRVRRVASIDVEALVDIPLTPEERLLLAIFDRALRDFARLDNSIKQEHRRTAETYFIIDDPSLYGTFAHLCDHFDRDYTQFLRMNLDAEKIVELFKQTKAKGTYTKWAKNKKQRKFRLRKRIIIDRG